MDCYPGTRVKLSPLGLKKWGQGYASWTGTSQCDCAPYTIKWDQSGSQSEHNPEELMPENNTREGERVKEYKKELDTFEAGVARFEKARGR